MQPVIPGQPARAAPGIHFSKLTCCVMDSGFAPGRAPE